MIKIFLDACIIIYWVEACEPFYTTLTSQLSHIAEQHPEHELVVSRLSILECLVKPICEKDKKIVKVYQDFFESLELTIIELDAHIVDLATQLRAHYHLRTPDALQAASCLSINDQHVFLTNDKHFNQVPNLQTYIFK